MLRDAKPCRVSAGRARSNWPREIKDHNYRIFAEDGRSCTSISAGMHLHDADPFVLFEQLARRERRRRTSTRPTPSTWATRWPRR